MSEKYTARAREIVAEQFATSVDHARKDYPILIAAIAAALQAAHDEGVERVARELDKWGWKGDADDIRALKHADRRGEGGGA